MIEGVLSAQEVARLNGAFDHFEPTMQPSPNYADGALSPRIASPDGPDSPSRMDLAQNPLQWPQPYCEPVRECLCHPNVVPYLNLILGKGYRLDHGPSLFLHRKGFAGQTLHGGGTSRADFSEQYMFKAGRIYSGLIVCEFFLADEPLGAGGLAIVPGSHKSELPLPSSLSRMEKHAHVVAEIAARAGDVVIFTGIATAINCKGHACGTQWCSTLPCIPCHIPTKKVGADLPCLADDARVDAQRRPRTERSRGQRSTTAARWHSSSPLGFQPTQRHHQDRATQWCTQGGLLSSSRSRGQSCTLRSWRMAIRRTRRSMGRCEGQASCDLVRSTLCYGTQQCWRPGTSHCCTKLNTIGMYTNEAAAIHEMHQQLNSPSSQLLCAGRPPSHQTKTGVRQLTT